MNPQILALPAPRVIGAQNIGPNKITLRQAAKLRLQRMTYKEGDGYWAKDTALLLRNNPDYYRVVTHSLVGDPPAGAIHRRKATSGKWGKARRNKFGAPLLAALTVSSHMVTFVHLDGTDITHAAPKGMHFEEDHLGVKIVRESDGMEYHPYNADWRKKLSSKISGGCCP